MRQMRRLGVYQLCLLKERRFLTDSHAFFELYGRSPEQVQDGDDKFSRNHTEASPTEWERALEEVFAQVYATPKEGVRQSSVRKALAALTASLSLPRDRRTRCNAQNWERAIAVWVHSGKCDLRSAESFLCVLYYSEKYTLLIKHADNMLTSLEPHALNSDDTRAALRVSTLCVLAHAAAPELPLRNKSQRIVRDLVKCTLRNAPHWKSEVKRVIAREYKLLIYALDWYFSRLDDPQLRQALIDTFSQLVPQRLKKNVFDSETPPTIDTFSSPASAIRLGAFYVQNNNHLGLRRLFMACKRREESFDGWRLFRLATKVGDMLSSSIESSPRALSDVVAFCGSSLSFESLKKIGSNHRCRSDVLQVLAAMEGTQAYFTLRHIFFHLPVKETANFQEKYGDLLTGDSRLKWRTALESMYERIARGDTKWRDSLPTVLRLLGDAGQTSEVFRLMRESSGGDDSATTLMSISGFAHAVRRSGEWWRVRELLDMMASCSPSRSEREDLFLQDVCLQGMYALRDGKRWKEALDFFDALAPVMPPAAHRVLCSVVCGMPRASPWKAALATLQGYGEVPEKFTTTLLCMWDPSRVEQVSHSRFWRYMLKGYAEGGHWKRAMLCVKGHERDESAWISVLRAAQRAALGSLPGDFFEKLHSTVWGSAPLLRLCVLTAEGHGYLSQLHSILQSRASNRPASEYLALVQFMLEGRFLTDLHFTDEYVIHRMLMSPSRGLVEIRVGWTKETINILKHTYNGQVKIFAQKHYKLHASCVPNQIIQNQKIFTLRAIAPSTTQPITVLATISDMIVVYKPPGALSQGYARAVMQWNKKKKKKPSYSLAYSLAPASSGLLLLVPSDLSTKSVYLKMKVFLRLCAINVSSLPLLSTEFFSRFEMDIIANSDQDGFFVVSAICFSDSDGLLAGSLYRLKESVTAEGWEYWEEEEEEEKEDKNGGGETVHLAELSVFTCHLDSLAMNSENVIMHFSSMTTPKWVTE